ncbi:MAG TPA: 50S ribosomal protein L25 [Spirochaetota bacterium]|mgnify:CR=1 FL=1|nr:50S ribosomal protein L25 [Spirochaetota bacterium]HPU87898.1 50S ribosomal protein L25 [Spirochaetota bacterium]
MKAHDLTVTLRTETGKNECNRLRAAGFIPGVVYSHGGSEAVKVNKKDFMGLFKGHISESVLINITVANKPADNAFKVFVKDYQLDPVTDIIKHVDFYKITAGEKIHTHVPVELTGSAEGERMGGVVEFLERELEIECLPDEMPEKIVIDITTLGIGKSIQQKDVPTSGSLKILGDAHRVIVACVVPQKASEEAAEPAAEVAETKAAEPEKEKKSE